MKSGFAIFLAIIGLLMSSCGLYFTVFLAVGIPSMLVFTLSSFVVGLLLIWAALRTPISSETKTPPNR